MPNQPYFHATGTNKSSKNVVADTFTFQGSKKCHEQFNAARALSSVVIQCTQKRVKWQKKLWLKYATAVHYSLSRKQDYVVSCNIIIWRNYRSKTKNLADFRSMLITSDLCGTFKIYVHENLDKNQIPPVKLKITGIC